jgi:hypothetical protein
MDLPELWASIEADLARARSTLPSDTLTHKAIRDYQEFLSMRAAVKNVQTANENVESSKNLVMYTRNLAIATWASP